jgi:hypothetical protein
MKWSTRDKSLLHQVILEVHSGGTNKDKGHHIFVSCNCRRKKGGAYAPMGYTENTTDTKRLYNDPNNHLIPFTEEDELNIPDSGDVK